MKKLYLAVFIGLVVCAYPSRATNVVIIESTSYNPGHVMDGVWLNVCTGLGYTAAIYPQTQLDVNTWFATTDVLIVSSGVINLPANRVATIQAFLLQGGRVYLQTEYLTSYDTNLAFQQIVTANGGNFAWTGTTAGTLAPMVVLGSLSNTPNTVTPLNYFWYGDAGVTSGCNSHVEPFMQYSGAYYGFIFCVPANNSRMITTCDQDWVNQSTSIPLMQNIAINLAGATYTCAVSGTALSVNLGPDTTICSGQSVTLNATSAGATSYLWSTGATPATISVSAAGTYWVQVSNGTCTGSDTIVISSGAAGNSTVNATICVNSVYTLPGGRVVSATGTYVDTLVSGGGCDSIITTNLTVASAGITVSSNASICAGGSTQLSASGGLTYNWTPATGLSNSGIANPVASPASSTTYTVSSQVLLNNLIVNGDFSAGNTGFSSGYAYTPPPNTAEGQYWVSTNAQTWNGGMAPCGDHTTGSGNMLLVNGATTANVSVWCETVAVTPNTSYAFSTWLATLTASNPAQLQFSINGILIGPVFTASPSNCIWQQFYAIWNSGIATTANICIVNQNTVASGNDFALDDISFSPLCTATDTVRITVNPTYANTVNAGICQGGTYTRPNGNTTGTAGTYVDTLLTVNSCDSIITTILTVNPVYSFTVNPTICPTDAYTLPDGTVVFATGAYITHLQTIHGCDSMITTNLTVVPSTLVASNDTAVCAGNAVQLSATGGLYSYAWTPRAGLTDSSIANPIATPALTTTYVVTSQSASGNLIVNGDFSAGNAGFSSSYTYTNNLVPEATYNVGPNPNNFHPGFSPCTDHTTGTGNMMVINGAGTANVSVWCETISVLPNTNYAFSCWAQSVSNGNPAQLQFSINGGLIGPVFTIPLAVCVWQQFYTIWNSGAATSANICVVNQNTASGGNDFALDDITFNGICTVSDTVTVTVNHPDTTVLNPTICQGTVYTFPGGTISAVSKIDTAWLSNRFGCDSNVITNLTVNPSPVTNVAPVICYGTKYTLPTGVAVNIAAIYTDTLITGAGCDSIIITTLTVTPPPVTNVAATICFGTNYNLPGGLAIKTSGVYNDTLITAGGCDSVVITTLTVTPPPLINLYDSICAGQSFTRPSGIVVNAAGIYVDTLIAAGGCDSVVITNLAVNPISSTTVYDTICHGASFTLQNGSSVNTPGSYPVTLSNRFGCDSVVTNVLTVINVSLVALPWDVKCNGQSTGTIGASATGGVFPYNYQLALNGTPAGNNNDGTFNHLVAGSYDVTATDNFGCTATTSISVNQPPPLFSADSPLVNVSCYGMHDGKVTLSATGGTPGYSFKLDDKTNTSGVFSELDTGTYEYFVTDNNGCVDSAVVSITQPAAINISIAPDSLVMRLGKSLQLNAGCNYDPNAHYLWNPIIGLSCFTCPNPVVSLNNTTDYNVLVTVNINGNNCSADTNITITVIPDYDIFIPNVFSPNKDGNNDYFQLYGNLPGMKFMEVQVFDRIGEKVFESNDIYFKWDGTYKGKPVPVQVLIYTIRAVFDDNHTEKLFTGSLTVLR